MIECSGFEYYLNIFGSVLLGILIGLAIAGSIIQYRETKLKKKQC